LRRDLRIAVRSRIAGDKTPNQTAWLYDYDVGAATDAYASE
jgi:hypothetical protein